MRKEVIVGLLIALLVVVALSPFASKSPDGLERVAHDKGFIHKQQGKEMIKSPIRNYELPGVGNKTVSGIAAGAAGIVLSFGVMFGAAKVIGSFKKKDDTVKE